jgi:hypothetical protein
LFRSDLKGDPLGFEVKRLEDEDVGQMHFAFDIGQRRLPTRSEQRQDAPAGSDMRHQLAVAIAEGSRIVHVVLEDARVSRAENGSTPSGRRSRRLRCETARRRSDRQRWACPACSFDSRPQHAAIDAQSHACGAALRVLSAKNKGNPPVTGILALLPPAPALFGADQSPSRKFTPQ